MKLFSFTRACVNFSLVQRLDTSTAMLKRKQSLTSQSDTYLYVVPDFYDSFSLVASYID